MSKVACKFLGARPLKSGELTGMVVFDKEADEHKLIDLRRRGTVYLTDEAAHVVEARTAILQECRGLLDRIQSLLGAEEAQEELLMGRGKYEADTLPTADEPGAEL